MEAKYRDRLRAADEKLRALRSKERQYAQMEVLKARSEEAHRTLMGEIATIKNQKVRCKHGFVARHHAIVTQHCASCMLQGNTLPA